MFFDEGYVQQLAHRLDLFHQVQKEPSSVYNFRCPLCGDSQKIKTKTRGYLYETSRGKYVFHCHNCGRHYPFGEFLEQFDDNLYRQYLFDQFTERRELRKLDEQDKQKKIETPEVDPSIFQNVLEPLTSLKRNHPCVVYVKGRKIPHYQWKHLYHCSRSADMSRIFPRYEKRLKSDEPRLVLPVFDATKRLIGLIGRAYREVEPLLRYLTLRATDDARIVYGLDRIRFDRVIYVVEGPIDSLFLPNAVAAAGSALRRLQEELPSEMTTYIWDHQPRNKDVVSAIAGAAKAGLKVCVWPDDLPGKDINDLVMSGWDQARILEQIRASTYQGLEAQLAVGRWQRLRLG